MYKINITELAKAAPDVTFHVQARDLENFGKNLLSMSRAEFAQQQVALNKTVLEPLYSADEVKAAWKISDSTLYRWSVRGFLVPIIVGGEKRYRKQDLDRILNSKK